MGSQRNQRRCKMNGGISKLLSRSPGCIIRAQRRSCLEAMDWSHSSITSFRETAWAKVQRDSNSETQPCSSLRSLSLSRVLPLPLLSSSLFLCLILPSLSFSPGVLSTLLSFLFFLISAFLFSFLTQLNTCYFCFPSCCLCFPLLAL